MKNTLKYRKEVDEQLSKCFNHLIELDKGICLTPYLKKLLSSELQSTKILAKSVLRFLFTFSNTKFIFDNSISETKKLFLDFQEHGDKSFLFDLKRKLEDENERFLVSYELSQYKDFHFNSDDALLEGLNFIDFFTSLCDSFRLKKFRYLVDDYYDENKDTILDLDKPFNIYDAFPDADSRFTQFIQNRVNLYYLNFLLDKTKTVDHRQKDMKENLELFKPGSDFSKIFNDQKVIPELIYDFLKDRDKKFFTQANLNRLRYILEHSKYLGHVIIKGNDHAPVTFTKVTGMFIGKDYDFKDESINITDRAKKIVKGLKKFSDRKNLNIKYKYV
ncbi:hypothetical protein G3567_12465 [Psychroflexus sp. YR1-1]|uniref:Uncharacterized protein n=1 Tax=Psychroflexus aurantiacus TaxID=2709310 RepID=A0A6B3R3B7_9FLAO|nr:hypothetical protein [Psychroflexus aurantiacus]NEV94953.1 hypothetical protein [Psychroflexus aurantiacus]